MLKMLRPEKSGRQLTEERLENLWNKSPELFDSARNCREAERIERTWELIKRIPALEQKVIIDVGCGKGEIARRLKDLGAVVHALDGSPIALSYVQSEGIFPIHDYLPKTKLQDEFYDIVICTDVIAYLPPQEHRLLMLELSRIVKKEGYIVCSTPLDINSEDPFEVFQALLQTEFVIDQWLLSHHALHIKIRNFLEWPNRFSKTRRGPFAVRFWRGLAFLLTPLSRLFRHNRKVLHLCEKLTKGFNDESGVSHAACIAKRRALF